MALSSNVWKTTEGDKCAEKRRKAVLISAGSIGVARLTVVARASPIPKVCAQRSGIMGNPNRRRPAHPRPSTARRTKTFGNYPPSSTTYPFTTELHKPSGNHGLTLKHAVRQDAFHLFTKLPMELQLEIWNFAMLDDYFCSRCYEYDGCLVVARCIKWWESHLFTLILDRVQCSRQCFVSVPYHGPGCALNLNCPRRLGRV